LLLNTEEDDGGLAIHELIIVLNGKFRGREPPLASLLKPG